jgi:hypothetical protein
MTVLLGENPWLLIGLTFLEVLFIIVPAITCSKIEKKPFNKIIKNMGFQNVEKRSFKTLLGICFGIAFYFLSVYINLFF